MLNYVNRVIVGKASGGANTGATLATITKGDIIVLSEDMAVLSDGAAKQPIYVAVGTGIAKNPFIMSSLIHPVDSMVVKNKATRAAADQVTFVGWNGTTGDIGAVVDKTVYEVILAFKDRQRIIANRQTRLVLNAAAEGTDKYDLCAQLERQARFSSPHSDPYGVRVDILAVGTTTVSDNTVRVTQNSPSITYATAATHNVGTAIIVGDVIAFDNIDYKVTKVAALELTLDRPFAAASEAAFTAADIDIKKTITAAGLKITGLASPYNNADIDVYEKVDFEVGVSESFASAAVDYSVASDLGQGVYEQVKQMEFDVQGYLGNTNLVQWPIHSFDYHAVAGTAYDIINITSQDYHEGDLQKQMSSPVGLTLAFSATASTQRDAVDAIIEDALGISALSW